MLRPAERLLSAIVNNVDVMYSLSGHEVRVHAHSLFLAALRYALPKQQSPHAGMQPAYTVEVSDCCDTTLLTL